jgi:putative endonuclease
LGEKIAARFLVDRGLSLLGHNVEVGRGEIDLLMSDRGERVVVEVRAITGPGDPIDAIGWEKRRRVGRLARELGRSRVDLIGVGVRPSHIVVHWVPDAV